MESEHHGGGTRRVGLPILLSLVAACGAGGGGDDAGAADDGWEATDDIADDVADAVADAVADVDAEASPGDALPDLADVDAEADAPVRPEIPAPERALSFVINAQDFSRAEELALPTMERLVSIHEAASVPLDIYVTDTMLAALEDAPDGLLERLSASPWVTFGYHIRPPKPYYQGYDWTGDLAGMSGTELANLVRDYETRVTDPTDGAPTGRDGGLAQLASRVGGGALAAGAATESAFESVVQGVFAELGATMFVSHGGLPINLGDVNRHGHLLRPEHVDLILIGLWEPEHAAGGCRQEWDADPVAVLDDAIAHACDSPDAATPCVVGVKIHDNDLFACDAAWTTVYNAPGSLRDGPPFPTSLRSELLDAAEQERRWAFYEGLVARAVEVREQTPSAGMRDFARWLGP